MGKIISFQNLDQELEKIHAQREQIILAGGCFDILHVGHIEYLEKSKQVGGKLVVLVESDESIRKIKGENRPINTQNDRTYVLSRLSMVDYVIPLPLFESDSDYQKLVHKIKPDIITITQDDPNLDKKLKQAKSVNGKLVEVIKRKKEYSTTQLIKNIKK